MGMERDAGTFEAARERARARLSSFSSVRLGTLDRRLIEPRPRLGLLGAKRLGWEFFLFGL